MGKVSTSAPELNNWLSAVMSYQQTCIDGFPKGKMKSEMEKMFKESRELVSNSLAVVSQVASVFSVFQGGSSLLSGIHLPWDKTAPAPASPDVAGLAPNWAPSPGSLGVELLGTVEKPTPNVTVANDGSGEFKTIFEELSHHHTKEGMLLCCYCV